jgi:hypothetical protein
LPVHFVVWFFALRWRRDKHTDHHHHSREAYLNLLHGWADIETCPYPFPNGADTQLQVITPEDDEATWESVNKDAKVSGTY